MEVSTTDHPALALLPDVPTREQIEQFGHAVLAAETRHGVVDIGTMHQHAGKLYGRSVVIPASTFLIGLPHKAAHMNVCVGDITVWTEAGRQRLTGAHIIASPAGDMRVGFAHSETTWLSVHVNDTGTTDTTLIEDALIEHSERLMTRRVAQGALQ